MSIILILITDHGTPQSVLVTLSIYICVKYTATSLINAEKSASYVWSFLQNQSYNLYQLYTYYF